MLGAVVIVNLKGMLMQVCEVPYLWKKDRPDCVRDHLVFHQPLKFLNKSIILALSQISFPDKTLIHVSYMLYFVRYLAHISQTDRIYDGIFKSNSVECSQLMLGG